jgi:4-hydroxyproline epimerase
MVALAAARLRARTHGSSPSSRTDIAAGTGEAKVEFGPETATSNTRRLYDLGMAAQRVRIVDSHTEGEPTRVVVSGGPDLGEGTMAERAERLRREFDWFRTGVILEPRGSDILVGALIVPPTDPECATGVIYFNNAVVLGMCGHGTIGLVKTLEHLGRIGPGVHRIETPVGTISAELHADGAVTVNNVPSYRHAKDVEIDVPGYGKVVGDIAYGGNWFFLVYDHPLEIGVHKIDELMAFSSAIRRTLDADGVTGTGGAVIDHIELYCASPNPGVHSRNFVLCPGMAYDRSPCGTGTSAKLACLVADGKLHQGEEICQESVLGTCFYGSVRIVDGVIHPSVRGTAYITLEGELLFDVNDPLRHGIRP